MIDEVTGMVLVYVPKGCFTMGQSRYYQRHDVCVDSFGMGKQEVTQGQWKNVIKWWQEGILDSNPAKFKNGDDYPIENVSWYDTQQFIARLNKKSGKAYRLPTEAEWEYAASAGTTTMRYWGDGISCDKAMYGNHQTSDEGCCADYNLKKGLQQHSTAPVGSYPANQFGLHDMLGNVWEFCADWYSNTYYAECQERGILENPQGPDAGLGNIIRGRGGGWAAHSTQVWTAYRRGIPSNSRYNDVGFRLVLPVR